MAKIIKANTLLAKHLTERDRVLLLNPPVEETRYNWVRWNQPLDLLKIASYLRSKVRCRVELIDCMKPDANGIVPEDWLPRGRRSRTVKDARYPMRRYGTAYGDLAKQLASIGHGAKKTQTPTQVWITSLCSYWYEGMAEVCRLVRKALPDSEIVLTGQYAQAHADARRKRLRCGLRPITRTGFAG